MRTSVCRAAVAVAALVSCASLGWAGWFGVPGWAGVPGAGAAPPDAPSATAAGLEQAWATSQGTWAVVAMGHLDTRTNTFWQLFFRPAGATLWSLVTPPGVATNGGLSADGTSGPRGEVVAGFQPSQYLRYSPLAVTTDHGRRWSAGTLSSALVFSPDAVASDTGTVLALLRAGDGTLVRSDGSITKWSTVATAATLGRTAAGRACEVVALRAVVAAAGAPEIGADCARPGTVGIFRETRGTWRSSAPRLAGARSLSLDVLHLWNGAKGTTALIERRGARGGSLVVAWRAAPGSGWTVSAPLGLSGDVLSTATGTGSAVAVVTSAGWHADEVESIAGPGSRWRSEGRPPVGTQVVAFTGGELVALAVHDSHLSVWRTDASGGWRGTSQRLAVPIEYGSST